jgi:hypothetical protein
VTPLTAGGFLVCQHCMRIAQADDVFAFPGIFNVRSNMRHLLRADEVTTYCGRNTRSHCWEEPISEALAEFQ